LPPPLYFDPFLSKKTDIEGSLGVPVTALQANAYRILVRVIRNISKVFRRKSLLTRI